MKALPHIVPFALSRRQQFNRWDGTGFSDVHHRRFPLATRFVPALRGRGAPPR